MGHNSGNLKAVGQRHWQRDLCGYIVGGVVGSPPGHAAQVTNALAYAQAQARNG
jgi:hypothetical protein